MASCPFDGKLHPDWKASCNPDVFADKDITENRNGGNAMTDAQRPTSVNWEHTTQIVAAYVRRNQVAADALPALISTVHEALGRLGTTLPEPAGERTPAVPVRRSVHRDYVVCIECGWRGQMLRRHIAGHGLSVEQYRARWNLKPDHPITAPGYSERRSAMARQIGLGRGRGALAERKGMHETKTVTTPQPSPKRRGRPRSSDLDRAGVDPTQHDRGGGG